MSIYRIFFVLGLACLLFPGCTTPDDGPASSQDEPRGINKEQRELADVKTGRMELKRISSVVSCTGEIEVPPQGMASVTAPLGGFIVETDIVPGAPVKKGSVLARLSNPEYISLQQSYLETVGQLRFAEQDYNRQKTLQEQDATAVKRLQESESSYMVLKARLAGLKEQLRMIGINFRELENGNIQSVVSLRAPLSGFVTTVNHHPGQFVEPREVIFEIVNMDDLHLHLNVFEQDIARIQQGQSVRFRPSGVTDTPYWGEISLVSPQRKEDLRTFDIHGHIEKEDNKLKPGMYVDAEILVSDDSVYALPEQAFVLNGNKPMVMVEEGGEYAMHAVSTGARMDGWVEVRNPETLLGKDIVTEGASRLFTAINRD